MTTGELIDAARGVPWVATGLVVVSGLTMLVERATGLAGPATKLAAWWLDREVRQMRREAALRAERRRLDREEEEGRVAALRSEVEWLRREVQRLHSVVRCTCVDTSPLPAPRHAARNPAQVPVPRR